MPGKPLDQALMQDAINQLELNNGNVMQAARSLGIPYETFRHRVWVGQRKGVRPTVQYNPPKPFIKQRLGKMHLIIPDCQIRDGVPTEHLEWIGNYIVEKKPDNVICIGDFGDMPSLSSYSRGKREAEGKRLRKDIDAIVRAQEKLWTPLHNYNRTASNKYEPDKDLTLGNHEYRTEREVEENPRYEGMFSMDDLGFKDFGWKIHPFLKPVDIDGIEYCHYFTSGNMGRPVTSAAALLRERQRSCTMGHVQHTDMAIHKKTQNIALFCGICYLHDEAYLGHQGNSTRRQIIVKHEVDNGRYDPMFVSLKYLEKNYS